MVNSRLGQFSAAPSSSGREVLHSTGASLLPKLRDHFAEFLNESSSDHLGILYLPTCVGFGTGTSHLPRRFSRRHGFRNFAHRWARHPVSGLLGDGFPYHPPYAVTPESNNRDGSSYPVPPSVIAVGTWYWNINQLSIAYAFRPRLRSRLTLSGRAFLRKP